MENREIKFRVWNTDSKKWVKNLTYCIDDFSTTNKEWHKVMQYTGRKDKNNNDVYEFDLLKTESGTVMAKFFEGSFMLVNLDGNLIKDGSGVGFTAWINDCEVIGNIYENPELLEK